MGRIVECASQVSPMNILAYVCETFVPVCSAIYRQVVVFIENEVIMIEDES